MVGQKFNVNYQKCKVYHMSKQKFNFIKSKFFILILKAVLQLYDALKNVNAKFYLKIYLFVVNTTSPGGATLKGGKIKPKKII